jgi:hypothetical protein
VQSEGARNKQMIGRIAICKGSVRRGQFSEVRDIHQSRMKKRVSKVWHSTGRVKQIHLPHISRFRESGVKTAFCSGWWCVLQSSASRFHISISTPIQSSSTPLYPLTTPIDTLDKMALLSSRINLLPTARALASGVPFAPKISFTLPAIAGAAHGAEGPRSDIPPTWVARTDGGVARARINGGSLPSIGGIQDGRLNVIVIREKVSRNCMSCAMRGTRFQDPD